MNIIQEFDTITAIATPIGTGGVGVIRISGDKSFEIISKIFSKKNIQVGKILHGWILDNEKKIDEVIVLPFLYIISLNLSFLILLNIASLISWLTPKTSWIAILPL